MPARDAGMLVLWPRYFDAALTRKQGRRVPRDVAVKDPDAKWVASAARKAGLDPVVEEDARHPSVPYHALGRVLVKQAGGKQALLATVAKQMASP